MKNSTIAIIVIFVVAAIATICACIFITPKEKTELKNEISEMEEQAKTDIEKAVEVTETDIHEAIDYIDEHVATLEEDFDKDVVKKVAYYGAYLKEAAKEDIEAAEHEIAKLGENTLDYVKSVYTNVKEKDEELAKELKEKVQSSLETIKKEKDKLVTEFKELISKL